jgi:predicted AlkP superfamily phosphohydrolase/phosphomutase
MLKRTGMATRNTPILVFVLSEASPVLVQRWIDAGKLPFLGRMAREGCAGTLENCAPLITNQMFADLYTGRRAQHHGIFDFVQKDGDGRFRETNLEMIGCDTLWDVIEQNRRTCGMVNLPLNWPPKSLNGYMISGQDSPSVDRGIASPPDLYDALIRKFGRYHLKDIFPGGRSKRDYLELFPKEIDWQSDVLAELITRHPCDFFMTFFSATAMAQHYFWSDMEGAQKEDRYSDLIESVYRRLDTQLSRLSRLAGPDARIFVVSECGAGPLKAGVNINAWLQNQGLLKYLRPDHDGRYRTRALSAAMGAAKRHLPESIKSFLIRQLPGLKVGAESFMLVSDVDWSKTTAYSRGKEGSIFVNLAGREPNGIIPAEEYSRVVERVAAQLSQLTDPGTGQPAVKKVYRREELYPGCTNPGAPDLTVEWVNSMYMPMEANRRSDQVFGPRWRANMKWPTSGSHRRKGIFFAQGPGIDANFRVNDAQLLDLFPTWLRMLEIPVPDDLPGRALEFCCRDAVRIMEGSAP